MTRIVAHKKECEQILSETKEIKLINCAKIACNLRGKFAKGGLCFENRKDRAIL